MSNHTEGEANLICAVCDASITKANQDQQLPDLCGDCQAAVRGVEIMCMCGSGMGEWHSEIIENGIQRLKRDKAAIRRIREFAPLLRSEIALALFSSFDEEDPLQEVSPPDYWDEESN